ncbi:hypothetical protein [Clostridium sp. JS66]|uniref:hypothetical protein n=1 Tax=Clostridium sp. JS66 TaxID=3064705 RepID=UPI00298E38C4|nr:hypothetical protein [Clostridium sp. JS66]WPC42241.1 hypothetical protein Q6H37_01825 [Clostridium sp. JS66]
MNKKLVTMFCTLVCTFGIAFTTTSQVQAKVKYVLVKDSTGVLYRYDYNSLKVAYALDKALYTDYTSKLTSEGPLAYYDDVNNFYVATKDIKLAYITQSGDFSMDAYTSSSNAKSLDMVAPVKEVSVDSTGKIVVTDVGNNDDSQTFDIENTY